LVTVTLSAAKGLAVGSETSTVGVNAAPRPRCFAPLSMTDEALQGYLTLYFQSNDGGGDWDDRYDVNSVKDVRSMNKQPAVYILASKRNGTLYVGVTSDLVKRVWEHSNNVVEGFTSRYGVHFLVYFEMHDDMEQAILREKRIKKWNRDWKIELIEKQNPEWTDL